ncbi:MAG: hypothetical protein JNL32_06465 [Candidatus Kapabacteria bacterium]|nr:hypothetical protein [Candidatus Kapabacteria bacterium]
MTTVTLLKKSLVVDMNNRRLDINDAVMDKVVEASQATKRDAFPLVKGHPKHDDPRYGSIAFKSVRREGDSVVAELQMSDETVANEIASGKYPGHSLKFSPRTGEIYHLGILGAKLPAIPDLPPIQLADAADDAVVVELADGRMPVVGMVLRKMRDKLIEDGMTAEEADKIIPADELGNLESYRPEVPEYFDEQLSRMWQRIQDVIIAVQELKESTTAGSAPAELSHTNDDDMEKEQLIAENEKLKQQLAEAQEKRESVELAAFVDSDDIKVRITPALREKAIRLLTNADATSVVELAAGDGEEPVKTNQREMLMDFMRSLPTVVELAAGGIAHNADAPARTSEDDEAKQMSDYVNNRFKK